MMNACANTETRMSGKYSQNSSTSYLSLQLLKVRSSACMVVSLLPLTHLIRSVSLIEYKKYHMRVPSVTFFGLTLMIAAAGAYLHVELVIHLDRTSLNSSTMRTGLNWYLVLISWWWMDTTGRMKEMWWRCSRHLTIVTDAVTRQR